MILIEPTTIPLDEDVVLIFENEPSIISQFEIDWPVSIFNTVHHIQNQLFEQVFTFVLVGRDSHKAKAFFHLFIDNQWALSPKRGVYGSFEIQENISDEALNTLVKIILDFGQERGWEGITIKHFPTCYDLERSLRIENALFNNGFKVNNSFENQYLTISDELFETQLHLSEKRRLRKCSKAGFVFEEIQNPDLRCVYQFISESRLKLGYSLSFGLNELIQWFESFPENYKVFCVKDQETIASLTIAVKVIEGVLYNFCPTNHLNYRTFSPSVLLTKGLYEYCQHNDFKILDLGISVNAEGDLKPSLAKFKLNLGAQKCEKNVYVYIPKQLLFL